ncbi:MAG: hypothetical protein H3C62_00385 [Gemmatimonadaceae bacterium]|nr:hypothetical protein [Gemmatimonadaceae bacterium]
MTDTPWLPRLLHPARLGALTVWYALFHLVSGLALIILYPSASFTQTLAELRGTLSTAMLIAAIGALTVTVSRYVEILWTHVIPEMRRSS